MNDKQELTKELLQFLKSEGYFNIRIIPAHGICGLFSYGASIGICCGMTHDHISYRYCYENEAFLDAKLAIILWNGEGHPPGPWIKRKGLGEDLINIEYVHEQAIMENDRRLIMSIE
jgi:hypothetical protein